MAYIKNKYCMVAVETGSWSDTAPKRWEEARDCGHKHRTLNMAKRCRERLQQWYCEHGVAAGHRCGDCLGGTARSHSTSALWFNARIHNESGHRIDDYS